MWKSAVFAMSLPLFILLTTAAGWSLSGFRGGISIAEIHRSQNATATHEYFMQLALQQATKASKNGEVPVGAVVVGKNPDGSFEILSRARNAVESSHDASAHAELLAMRKAAKRKKNWRLSNCTLYTTLEPCPM